MTIYLKDILVEKPLISKQNWMVPVKFTKEHLHWTKQDCSKVLWRDESKYNWFSSDPKNKREDLHYMVSTVKHKGGTVMVWGCFSRYFVGSLVQIEGNIGAKYYTNMMKNHMLPHVKAKVCQ